MLPPPYFPIHLKLTCKMVHKPLHNSVVTDNESRLLFLLADEIKSYTQNQLSNITGFSQSVVSRAVTRLKQRNYIIDAKENNTVLYYLTEEGKALLLTLIQGSCTIAELHKVNLHKCRVRVPCNVAKIENKISRLFTPFKQNGYTGYKGKGYCARLNFKRKIIFIYIDQVNGETEDDCLERVEEIVEVNIRMIEQQTGITILRQKSHPYIIDFRYREDPGAHYTKQLHFHTKEAELNNRLRIDNSPRPGRSLKQGSELECVGHDSYSDFMKVRPLMDQIERGATEKDPIPLLRVLESVADEKTLGSDLTRQNFNRIYESIATAIDLQNYHRSIDTKEKKEAQKQKLKRALTDIEYYITNPVNADSPYMRDAYLMKESYTFMLNHRCIN